jgi:hypothetical protein
MPAPFQASRFAALLGFAASLSISSVSSLASADGAYQWQASAGEEHGSQVASSEWLPIVLGAAIGTTVGALGGSAVDDSQPAIWGPIIGGTLGAVAGGGGGAWVIRAVREQDTRLAGAVTGAGLGAGFGGVLFAKTDPLYGKIPALVLGPLFGGFVGWKLADYYGPKRKAGDAAFVPSEVHPVATPLVSNSGAHGVAVGLAGAFF